MFLQKYKPQAISGMVANRIAAGDLKRAVSTWKKGSAVVLSGPPGCGKTLAVELIAKELGVEVVSGDIDDLVSTSRQSSIWARGKILVADIDTDLSQSEAYTLIEESNWPVVLVTVDIYQRNLADIRKDRSMHVINFQKAGNSELAGFLKRVCVAENIACSERALYDFAQRSDGDVRWSLIALESLKNVDVEAVENLDRERVDKLFNTLDSIFQRRMSEDIDFSGMFPWVIENLPERYGGDELAKAYRCTAAASRFQRFGFEQHAQEMLKLLPSSRISAQYKFPRWTGGNGSTIEGIHCSAKKARAYSQVINRLQKKR